MMHTLLVGLSLLEDYSIMITESRSVVDDIEFIREYISLTEESRIYFLGHQKSYMIIYDIRQL
jgi:hypothetical protein